MSGPFPQHYEVSVEASPRHAARITAPPRPEIVGGAEPELEGHEGWWTPEHLLLSSAALCFVQTFESLARRAQTSFAALHCEASGTVDRTAEGPRFTEIVLRVAFDASGGDAAQGRKLLEAALARCLVTGSLKTRVALELIGRRAKGS